MTRLGYPKYAFAVLILFIACGKDDGIKYYRHLRMDKIHDLTFAYPVAPRDSKRINCYEVQYDDYGRIIRAVYLKKGTPAFDSFNELSTIEIEYRENKETRQVRDLEGNSIYGEVAYFTYEFSDDSLNYTCTNYSKDSTRVEDSSGVAVYLYTNHTSENEITQFRLDIDGDTIMDYNLNYKVVKEYDESANIIKSSNYNVNDCLQLDKDGIAVTGYKYDEDGNCTDILFCDEKGKRTSHEEYGCSRVTRSYDPNGNMIRVAWWDEKDSLYFCWDKGFAFYEMKYSENGDLIEIRNFIDINNPTYFARLNESGDVYEYVVYSRYKFLKTYRFEEYEYQVDRCDSTGRVLETTYFDKDNTYYYRDRGYVSVRYEYDEAGNKIEQTSYSKDGYPVEDVVSGVAACRYNYNDLGNVVGISSFSVDGEPVEDRSTGIATIRYKYDEFGEQSEIGYYGLDGRLKEDKTSGIAKMMFRRFDNGLSMESSVYDSQEKPTILSECCCFRYLNDFDEKSNKLVSSFFGINNELVFNDKEGYAFSITEFKREEFTSRISYYDVDSTLIINKLLGFAIEEEVIENGKTIESRHFDADGNLIDVSHVD